MNEFDLISEFFQQRFDSSLDINQGGDDCAAIVLPSQSTQHLSIDTMVAGRHFFENMPAFDIGYRALATAASDLAAAGAKPWWFSLALSLPDCDTEWLDQFSRGLKTLADELGIQLIGGDTTRGPLTISVQVAGLSPDHSSLTRSGANDGDLLCVGGSVGDAAGGLQQWGKADANDYLKQRYCRPKPQCDLGVALQGRASSCIDISDGLLAEAQHIAKASKVGLNIDVEALPISSPLLTAFGKEQATEFALCGGDDYRLLFTVPSNYIQQLSEQWPTIRSIGEVRSGEGVYLINSPKDITAYQSGFTHF